MSERLTGIRLPGAEWPGISDWGRRTPAEMIDRARAYGRFLRQQADAILSAADADFQVETFLGPLARRQLEVLQASAKRIAQ